MSNWRDWLIPAIGTALVAGIMSIVGWTLLETIDHGRKLEVINTKLDAVLAAVEGQEERLRQAEITLATHETVIMQWGYPE